MNYEKVGVYIAIMIGFLTTIFYIVDIKDCISQTNERVAKLEVKVEKLEESRN